MKRWYAVVLSAAITSVAVASHDNDLLFGEENGQVVVIQPTPHPVRTMSTVFGSFILDVGMDFYWEPNTGLDHLSFCRVQQVWITPGLQATKSGFGTVFCASGCPNFFDLPTNGTPHHHFIFAVSQPGVYVWDLRAVNARARDGRLLADMAQPYRVYMVAGTVRRLFGSVSAPNYQGDLYNLPLTVQIRQNGTVVAQRSLPPNITAVHHYMVGFTQSGVHTVVAKLDKHLSRRADNFNLSSAHRLDWTFDTAGDVNNDDVIDDADLLQVLFAFGSSDPASDVNGDGVVDDADLLIILFNFGAVGEGSQP
ncbi:MAG: hypothetical protein SNJ72_00600 [Fimbriimonadales bacterium]